MNKNVVPRKNRKDRHRRKSFSLILWIGVGILIFAAGCVNKEDAKGEIRIAEQYGFAYAPLQIMQEKKFLEDFSQDVSVQWVRLGNTAAIREAALAGDLDIGFMGIPPFLIARDKGMQWKIATGLSRCPLGLAVPAGQFASLTDIPSEVKIALPQPGSIQHILLSMALERETGDPSYLDATLISMKHPDGMNALLSGSVAGHFTSPPYLFLEEEEGFEILVSGEEALGGPFTFIAGVATEKFYTEEPDLYEAFLQALDKAIRFMQEQKEETVAILSELYEMEEAVVDTYLYHRGIVFERELYGLDRFIPFMQDHAYIDHLSDEESIRF